jgi:predicted nucleic acid-binding Zn ribbon protein
MTPAPPAIANDTLEQIRKDLLAAPLLSYALHQERQIGYCPAEEFVGRVLRGHGGRGVRRRLTDALPDQHERGLKGSPQVSPGSARAPVEGSPASAGGRLCPICDEPLRPRQQVCSGRCRAELSRRRQAQLRHARDQQIRELLVAALDLMGKDGPP